MKFEPINHHSTSSTSGDRHEGHSHGAIDLGILTTSRGIWAVKWSFAGLGLTALLQVVIVAITNSIALLADTIHNIGDATTAIPLWIAFTLARRKPSRRFTYGLGRVEDLAGMIIILTILFSAIVAFYQAIDRFIHPQPITHLWVVAVAAIIGFIGNETVAMFRIRVGKEISSAALVADGNHARIDGFTSLGVLGSAIGVWLGFPLADPIVGLLITIAILKIVWDSSKEVFTRILDGVDPKIVHEIEHSIQHVDGVYGIEDIKARWIGHRLTSDITITVKNGISIDTAHSIASIVEHEIHHHIDYLSSASIHIHPKNHSDEGHSHHEN